jgi:H+/Cl- antiporter ClcA
MASKPNLVALGIALGAALGTVFGVMAGHVGAWLAVGIAIGVAIGARLRPKETQCPECGEIHKMHSTRRKPTSIVNT